jgi:hypothetical protein
MKKMFAFIFLVLVFILSSCQDSSLNDYSKTNVGKDLLGMILNEFEIPDDLSYSFYVYKAKQSILINADDSLYSITNTPYQNFYNAYLFDNAGTVSIAGNYLQHSNGTYNNFVDDVDLDGSNKEYVIQGGGSVPAFSFQLESPLNYATILTPAHASIHDADNDLLVSWAPEPSKNMIVVLSLLTRENDSTYLGIHEVVLTDDIGSYSFPSSILQQFKSGILQILLRRGNYTFGYAPNDEQYGAFTFSQNSIRIVLTD